MHRAMARLLAQSLCLALCVAAGIVIPGESAAAPAAAPVLSVPGPQTVDEGAALAFLVTATDADGQTVIFRVSGLPAGATVVDNHNNTASFSWTPDMFQAGSYLVWFTADDTFGGTDTRSVSIQVQNVNSAPVLDPIGDRSIERGTSAWIMVSGYDPDGDPLSYSHSGLPAWATFTDYGDGSGALYLAPPANEPPGSTAMTVSLSDGFQTTSETFSITVYSIGNTNAPVLAPIADQTVTEGGTASVNVSATDADQDMLSWSVSLPGFVTFTPTGSSPGSATARLDLAPGYCAAGLYPASVSVSDGALSAAQGFSVTVLEVNRQPAWVAPQGGYAMSLNEGSSATLAVQASDPDQECGIAAPALALGAGVPTSLSVSLTDQGGGAGLLRVAAGYDAAGTYTFPITATDAADPALSVAVSVQVTVSDVNRAPVADAAGPYSVVLGNEALLSAEGSSDPDGDELTYSWSFGDGSDGSGVVVSHQYGEVGQYVVTLTVGDGSLTSTATTTVDVTISYQARAFMDPSTIRLHTGKPREAVYLEAVGGSFEITSVQVSSLKLSAPLGSGSVPYIQPLEGETTLGEDRDRNNVAEMRMVFSKEDLRALFSNVSTRSPVTLVLSATLFGGGYVETSFGVEVWPERKAVAHRVHPNPMNPDAVISLSTLKPGYLSLRLYDLNGRLVRTLLNEANVAPGSYEVVFDGRDDGGRPLASGQYFYRVDTPSERSGGSIMILK